MGELGAFLKVHRVGFDKRDPHERVRDYDQYFALQPEDELQRQGARCMDCGIPFCHEGCPLGNLIPDWNDLVYRGKWREAIDQLHSTNNFPEFTGLICPSPCESACVLAINDDPVTIEQIELAIVARAFDQGWVVPEPPERRTALAMDYLYQRNRWVAAQEGRPHRVPEPGSEISAGDKKVIVIGGGDTGMDCISNSHREGARSVVMLDVYGALPSNGHDPRHPWPL